MGFVDDGVGGSKDTRQLVGIPTVCGRIGDPEGPSNLAKRRIGFVDVLPKGNGSPLCHPKSISRKRAHCQPTSGNQVIHPTFGYPPPMGKAEKPSLMESVFQVIFDIADREGWPSVRKQTQVASSTTDRWDKARHKGKIPSASGANLEALCKIDRVRIAAASSLMARADQDQVAWEDIAGRLAKRLSPVTGFRLVERIRELDELGLLDSDLSAIKGMADARQRAVAEKEKAKKLTRSRPKKKY